MSKEFQVPPDSFKIISLTKKLPKLTFFKGSRESITRVQKSNFSIKNYKLRKRGISQFSSQEAPCNIEVKSLTPLRLYKKSNISDERDSISQLSISDIKQSQVIQQNFNISGNLISQDAQNIYQGIENSENAVFLLKSIYENRPSTVFFDYPNTVNQSKNRSRVIPLNQINNPGIKLSYHISENFSYPCIINILKSAGFSIDSNFNLNIEGVIKGKTFQSLLDYQKTNHFPGSNCLGRKDSM